MTISHPAALVAAAGALAAALGAPPAAASNVKITPLGSHDGVFVMEAPDDEAAASVLLHLGAAGNVRTTTLRAFDWAEAQQLISESE